MRVVGAGLATVLVVFLLVGLPFLGRRRYRLFLDRVRVDPGARLGFLLRGIVRTWLLVGVIGLIGALTGRGPASIALPKTGSAPLDEGLIVYVLVVFGASPSLDCRSRPASARRWSTGDSPWPTSGGPGHRRPDGFVIALSAVAFGFAHLYQGWRGVILTGILGAVFADVVLTTRTLLPVMAIHALIDLRNLAIPTGLIDRLDGAATQDAMPGRAGEATH